MKNFLLIVFLGSLFVAIGVLIPPVYAAQENQCLTCHTKFNERAKSVHAAMGMGCEACHKAAEGKTHPGQKDSIILTQKMPELCFSCHDGAKFKGKSVHQPVSGGMCTGCHDPHQSSFPKILVKDVPGLCYNCHQESKFTKGKYGHTVIGMCTGCHSPHASKADKLLISDPPELCYNCHDKAKFTKKYTHAVVSMPNGCSICHTPHVSSDQALLLQPVFNLCTSCHAAEADGRHIVTIPGKKIHPLKDVNDPLFPGTKKVPDPFKPDKLIEVPDPNNPGKKITCVTCHDPHSSDFAKLFPQKNICERCHEYY
jgi:predicted CXXCH cytochrome family protein